MLRVTDGRPIYRLHSNVGPVYGASRSPADARLRTMPRIFNEIGGPPSGSKWGVIGPDDGSPPDGRTPTKVLIGDQKSTFGSRADVPSSTYPRSLKSIGCSNLWSTSGPPSGSPDCGQTPRKYIVDNGPKFQKFGSLVDTTSSTNHELLKRIGGNTFFLRLGGFRKPPDPEIRKSLVVFHENRHFPIQTTQNNLFCRFTPIIYIFSDDWLIVTFAIYQGNTFILRLDGFQRSSDLEIENFIVIFLEIRIFYRKTNQNEVYSKHGKVLSDYWLIVVFWGGSCLTTDTILDLIGNIITVVFSCCAEIFENSDEPPDRSSLTLFDFFFCLSFTTNGPSNNLLIVVHVNNSKIAIVTALVSCGSSHDDDLLFLGSGHMIHHNNQHQRPSCQFHRMMISQGYRLRGDMMISDDRNVENRDVDDDVNVKIRKITKHRHVKKQTRTRTGHDSLIGRLCDTKNYCRKGFWVSHASSTSSKTDQDPKFGPHLDPGLKRVSIHGRFTRLKNRQWSTLMPVQDTTISPTASELHFRTYYWDRGGNFKCLITYSNRDQMVYFFTGYCPELDDSPSSNTI